MKLLYADGKMNMTWHNQSWKRHL